MKSVAPFEKTPEGMLRGAQWQSCLTERHEDVGTEVHLNQWNRCRTRSRKVFGNVYPRRSMYGMFTYIYPKNDPDVGLYSIHGASEYGTIYGLINIYQP